MRLVRKNSLLSFIYDFAIVYGSPLNFNYYFNFGMLALVCLVMQIVSGVFLAMHYVPDTSGAFLSVEHIMRDVPYGALMRYTHANGASMFFIVVYIHVFKAIYNGSFLNPRQWVWVVGVIILLLMIITAFLGYVLPWGQMSLWAATVITSFITAIPVVGTDVVFWIWGAFGVSNPTLHRIYSLHYLLPMILALLAIVHLILLHSFGSNSPEGISMKMVVGNFTSNYMVKDMIGLLVFFIFASYFIFFAPNLLGHPDNYIPANPLVTPLHIVPEWYFLPFYAILRSVPGKLLGVIALLASILVLIALPFIITAKIKTPGFKIKFQILFWIFFVVCMFLGYIGGKPIESPYLELGQVFTAFYFSHLLIIMPLVVYYDWGSFYQLIIDNFFDLEEGE